MNIDTEAADLTPTRILFFRLLRAEKRKVSRECIVYASSKIRGTTDATLAPFSGIPLVRR